MIPGVDCKRASRLKQYLDPISRTVSKAAISKAAYSARLGSGGSSFSEKMRNMHKTFKRLEAIIEKINDILSRHKEVWKLTSVLCFQSVHQLFDISGRVVKGISDGRNVFLTYLLELQKLRKEHKTVNR